MVREQTCCFTGHRELPVWGRKQLAAKLEATITGLIDRGIIFYGAGGARGFDTLAAQTVLKLKPNYPSIKLILVLPCLTQTRCWRPEDIAEYERIKSQADKVVYTAQQYTPGCMHKRNRHLVDHSGVCVCYLTKESGGTAYTVRYAKEKGLEIVNLVQGEKCVSR